MAERRYDADRESPRRRWDRCKRLGYWLARIEASDVDLGPVGEAARRYFGGTAAVADLRLLVQEDLLTAEQADPASLLEWFELMGNVLEEDGDLADPVERRENRRRVTHYRRLVSEYFGKPMVFSRQRPRAPRTRRTRRIRARSGSRGDPPDEPDEADDLDREPHRLVWRLGVEAA